MAPNSPPLTIPELALQKKKRKKRRSKSPGDLLICCCRFVRRDKVQSPIYTARELSVASLGLQHQLALFGASSSSQQRPLVKTNGTQRIVMPVEGAFWDDTPSNTADYLDYGNGREMNKMEWNQPETNRGDEPEQMETARTSRIEDLIEYPSMDELLDEILSDSRGGDTVAMAINSNPCKKSKESAAAEERKSSSTKLQSASIFERKMPMPTQQQPPISTVNANGMAPASMSSSSRLATFQSPLDRLCPPVSIVTIPPSAASLPSFCPIPRNSPSFDDPEAQQQEGGLPLVPSSSFHSVPSWRLALSSLPQSISQLCWVAYFWVASSVALFLEWLSI